MIIDGYCTLGVDREYDLTAADLLAAMDAAGVDHAIIAAVDRYQAVDNRTGNDALLQAAADSGGRFIPSCSVSPWGGDAAVAELRRAVGEGARMLVLNPCVQGFTASDELVHPLLEVAGEARVPVYVHTGTPSATPWQIVDLAEAFASVDLIIGHSGATDFWNDAVSAVQAADNVYLESSLARPFLFVSYLKQTGWHKGLMGSGAPLNAFDYEWAQMRRELPEEAHETVCGGNLQTLLEKAGAL